MPGRANRPPGGHIRGGQPPEPAFGSGARPGLACRSSGVGGPGYC